MRALQRGAPAVEDARTAYFHSLMLRTCHTRYVSSFLSLLNSRKRAWPAIISQIFDSAALHRSAPWMIHFSHFILLVVFFFFDHPLLQKRCGVIGPIVFIPRYRCFSSPYQFPLRSSSCIAGLAGGVLAIENLPLFAPNATPVPPVPSIVCQFTFYHFSFL